MKKAIKTFSLLFISANLMTTAVISSALVVAEEINSQELNQYEKSSSQQTKGNHLLDEIEFLEEMSPVKENDNELTAPLQEIPAELTRDLVSSLQAKANDWAVSGETLILVYDSNVQTLQELVNRLPALYTLPVKKLDLQVVTRVTPDDHDVLAFSSYFINDNPIVDFQVTFLENSSFQLEDYFTFGFGETFSSNAKSSGIYNFASATVSEISLPNVNSIGVNAFLSTTNLRKLEIGVNEVDFAKFDMTTRRAITDLTLTSIADLTNNTTDNGLRSFTNLEYLTANAVSVGDNVLEKMRMLKSVDMPNATTFGNGAFWDANSLIEVSLPNAITFENEAFYNSNALESVTLPKATRFGNHAFRGASSLREVYLPNAESFGINAFYFNTVSLLTEVFLPKAITFGNEAFRHTFLLEELSLPNTTTFGTNAFQSANQLRKLELGVTDDQFSNINSTVRSAITDLTLTNIADLTNNTTDNGLRSFTNLECLTANAVTIGDNVLEKMRMLKSVNMPSAAVFGDNAFENASSLEGISLPNATIFGNKAFNNASSLKKVNLPNVTIFGDNAFSYTEGIEELTLNSAESFGSNAFSNSVIGVITLPSVTILPQNSFANSTIGFVKVKKVDSLNYEQIFTGKGSLIGIVIEGNEDTVHSVRERSRVTLNDSTRLYNTGELKTESFGIQWTKNEELVGPNTSLVFQRVNLEDVGEYQAVLWTENVPTIATRIKTDLGLHTLEVNALTPEIMDPENPNDGLIYPELKETNVGRLQILYASNFEFGEIKNNGREQIAHAKLQRVINEREEEGDRVPFVSTYDNRGIERSPWSLTVESTNLIDGSGHVLRGAFISIEDMHYAGNSEEAPKIESERVVITEAPQALVSSSVYSFEKDTEDTGVGNWSLALGSQYENRTSGVRLTLPSNTVMNEGVDYTATITWNLESTP